jgi:chromosome segregation ATPase
VRLDVRRAVATAIAAAALALPSPAWTADPLSDDPVSSDPVSEEDAYRAQKEMWQARFRAAREAVAEQQIRHREAVDAYKQMRHRRRQRGEEKQQILEELTAAEVAIEEAKSALEELYESARREGVPPGWMRMQRGGAPAALEPAQDEESALP